jgi:hypothetical protein
MHRALDHHRQLGLVAQLARNTIQNVAIKSSSSAARLRGNRGASCMSRPAAKRGEAAAGAPHGLAPWEQSWLPHVARPWARPIASLDLASNLNREHEPGTSLSPPARTSFLPPRPLCRIFPVRDRSMAHTNTSSKTRERAARTRSRSIRSKSSPARSLRRRWCGRRPRAGFRRAAFAALQAPAGTEGKVPLPGPARLDDLHRVATILGALLPSWR